jgi:tRNA-2-methylthio-N6-dimethylallyladenosine synthase
MNVRDSEVVCGLLKNSGYKISDNPDEAQVIIFNTCSVREHAEDKVWSEIGRYKNGKVIGLIGCMAKNYQDKSFSRAPNLSFVVGPADIDKIPDIISKFTDEKTMFERKIWETDGLVRPETIYHNSYFTDKKHSFVIISEGCSNYCSYCIVPYVRGELRHRKHEDILKEIKGALENGINSFTLIGQNVNSYNDADTNFIKLVTLINKIKEIESFDFVTSHPKDTTVELFKAIAGLEKLKKSLHLPAQSGSDRVLGLMNRGYSRKYYLELADSYRKIVKGGVLTTDIIVGFPSEGESDFEDTYSLVEKVEFNAAYIFKYSVRPYTKAANLNDDVPKEAKERRHKVILELQKKISSKYAKTRT